MKSSGGRSSSLNENLKNGIYERNQKSAISVFSRTTYTHQRNFSIPTNEMIKQSKCKSAKQLGNKRIPLLDQRLVKSGRISSKYFKNVIKIENYLEKEMIEQLKNAFAMSKNPENGLTLSEFREVLMTQLGVSRPYKTAIERLFTIINWKDDKFITWDLFCSYILVEFEKLELLNSEKREISFVLPAKNKILSSRDVIINITSGIEGSFTTYSRDGMVITWSPNLEIKKRKVIQTSRNISRTVPKWVMCCGVLNDFNKIILGTGDRELQIIDYPSFESYCKITELDIIPLCLETSSRNRDECVIMYGDKNGCITVILINNPGECLRLWKSYPISDGFPTQTFVQLQQTLFRWKVHNNWIQNMKYYMAENKVISCCNDDKRSVVMGFVVPKTNHSRNAYNIKLGPNAVQRHVRDDLAINVYKGVKAFAFSKELNILVTGGLDKQLRCWNPFVPHRPTGILRGHRNPIIFIYICPADEKIYSISTEINVKIWDIRDLQCILSIGSRSHNISGELVKCHYLPNAIILCTDKVAILPLRRKTKKKSKMQYTLSHDKQITSICYSSVGDVIASACEDSTIKVWDIEEGVLISEILNAHGRDIINCVCFDSIGLRLISGGYDGNIKVWNYLNGQCLGKFTKKNKSEFISCDFCRAGQNRFIIGVDSERVISIFADDNIKHPMFEWSDPQKNGDINSIKYWNNFLATCSSNGEVIIWNMISGHIFSRLYPNEKQPSNDSEEWKLVRRIAILHTRTRDKNSSMLIASGPHNQIHFWNPYISQQYASFPHPNNSLITSVCTNKSDKLLISGDDEGFINIWNIVGYAITECDHPPIHINNWKGHSQTVTEVIYIDNSDLIVSSSTNRTIKLWNLSGAYIGTFGQKWNILYPETYRHPNVEMDVLTEPLEDIQTDDKIIDEIFNSFKARKSFNDIQINTSKPINPIDMQEPAGRRLRRERIQMISNKIEGNEFHNLDIHSLTPCKY